MDKQNYLIELRQRLNPLPLSMDEIADAIQYYEEYFSEAGPEREQEVIKELGSPSYVAAQIALKLTGSLPPLADGAIGSGTPRRTPVKGNGGLAKMIILGVCAAPVALPLIIAAVAVIGALLIAAGAIVVSFGVTGIAMAAGSIPLCVYAAMTLVTDFSTGVYWVGGALFLFGLGGFMARFGLWIGRLSVKATANIGGRVIRRGKAKAETPELKMVDLRTSPETEVNRDAQEN
jgi:uncharacterized membrane protein